MQRTKRIATTLLAGGLATAAIAAAPASDGFAFDPALDLDTEEPAADADLDAGFRDGDTAGETSSDLFLSEDDQSLSGGGAILDDETGGALFGEFDRTEDGATTSSLEGTFQDDEETTRFDVTGELGEDAESGSLTLDSSTDTEDEAAEADLELRFDEDEGADLLLEGEGLTE